MSAGCAGCAVVRGGGPGDAGTFTYEVEYGDQQIHGEGDVTYTAGDGRQVSIHVSLPWRSDVIPIEGGRRYDLRATAPQRHDAALNCGMHLDSGWNVGQSMESDHCTYSYPD
jgi:hypothetical protein